MPKQRQMRSAPRQRPVSCRLCRSRKLRCNRETPCSNCVSRGIRCELENAVRNDPETPVASEPELVERIRKLEELLRNQTSQPNDSVQQQSENSDTHARQEHVWPQIEHLDKDFAWLESIHCGRDLSQDKIPSNRVVFRICSTQHIMEAQPYVNQTALLSSPNVEPSRCIRLPQYHEAKKILLEKFIQDIDYAFHVVHTPSLPNIVNEVYTSLDRQGPVRPGNMILLLGICASCTRSWVRRGCERGLFSAPAEANSQSPLWIKAIEDALDIAHRTTCVSIEGIQGIVIAIFVMANFEGFSRRCRSLFNVTYLLARELGLRCLDHPSNVTLASSAQAEIGRRVWWYLAASDWLVATRLSGLTQGVYQCHVRHMMVKKPLNINDEDLIDGMSRIEQPWSQPTTMSYSLQRIRLAETSRSIVDRTPLMIAHTGSASHDIIMDMDIELQLLINDIPPFFSMSIADVTETYHLGPKQAAQIVHQGYMAYSLLYSQRCKLHVPYFSRGYVDPLYASSRDLCLQSARLIIQTETQLDVSGHCTATRYRFFGLLVGVFMASIVLLRDLCHNTPSPHHEKQRGAIADAVRILEAARHESDTAARFLDSLMHVLRKHHVSPPESATRESIASQRLSTASDAAALCTAAATGANDEPAAASMPMASSAVRGGNNVCGIDAADGSFANEEVAPSYFYELAQSLDQGIDVGSFD